MSRIAVIGAGGYVGPFVCRALQDRGHRVTGIGRVHARIVLDPLAVPVRPEVGRGADFDAIINLAYPTTGSDASAVRQNQALLEQMSAVGRRGGRVIHVSTLAVFGFTLEYPPVTAPVARRRDFHYIESKIDLERRVWKAFRSQDAHIVRLGNVWGPGSPNWTAGIANALLFGLPTKVAGEDGFSNVTDAGNVAALLAALVETPRAVGLQYHHLAEFSSLRWSHWVGLLAGALGVEPVMAVERSGFGTSLGPELKAALGPGGLIAVYRRAVRGRYTGSWARTAVRLVPGFVVRALKRREGAQAVRPPRDVDANPVLLELLACGREFRTEIGFPWSPPIDAATSWDRVRAWMDRAGYRAA